MKRDCSIRVVRIKTLICVTVFTSVICWFSGAADQSQIGKTDALLVSENDYTEPQVCMLKILNNIRGLGKMDE